MCIHSPLSIPLKLLKMLFIYRKAKIIKSGISSCAAKFLQNANILGRGTRTLQKELYNIGEKRAPVGRGANVYEKFH